MVKKRSNICGTCKQDKGVGCENDSRCKACKSAYEKERRIKKRLAAGKTAICERLVYCDECKDKRARNETVVVRCTPCIVISNNLRRWAKREEEGLPPVAKRDSSFCHVCNIPKVDGRCAPCRLKAASERKAKKREEAGKRPWGDGRPLTCFQCGTVKENRQWAYCKACQSERDRIKWREVIAPRVNRKERTTLCACGNEKAPYNVSYCRACIAKQVRDRRVRARELKPIIKIIPLTPEEKKLRRDARALTNSALRRGLLTRGLCEVCGTDMVEAHHDDYYKALDIRWLCKEHHDEHHRNNP